MPRACPEEFRRRAVELARQREKSVSQIAADLGIAQSALHRWVRQADIDEGERDDGLTTEERAELVRLRRANRTHRDAADIALPPFVELGPSRLLHSIAGSASSLIYFLIRELRWLYRSDWDRAVGRREEDFRASLSSAFRPPR